MKFKDFYILAPVAFAMLACSPQTSTTASTNGIVGGANAAPIVNTATGPSSASGTSAAPVPITGSSCPQYPSYPIFSYPLTGTGTMPVTTSGTKIVADSKLRVSITPNTAGSTLGTGGQANYNNMSAVVHLLANGVEVGSFTVPAQGGNSGYTTGTAVGQASDPGAADFSSYLQSGDVNYTIRVDTVLTDYKCNAFCTANYYGCSPSYCGYAGYVYNWDYHQGDWACCPTNVDSFGDNIDTLDLCQQQQCGVGSVLPNSSWSLTVRVETDSTPCITP